MINTTQRVYLRHKLNPRRFGGVVLFRVTDAMHIGKAQSVSFKIRRTGVITRVDKFKDGYAVWISAKKRKVPVDKGRLGLDDSATKYLTSLLPDFWYVIKRYKQTQFCERGYYVDMTVVTARDNAVFLQLYEGTKFLELYSILAEGKGFGEGTIVMKALKKYVDSKRKGMVLRLVKNYRFVERFKWFKRMPREYGEYEHPDYYYKVNPDTKLRHLWR